MTCGWNGKRAPESAALLRPALPAADLDREQRHAWWFHLEQLLQHGYMAVAAQQDAGRLGAWLTRVRLRLLSLGIDEHRHRRSWSEWQFLRRIRRRLAAPLAALAAIVTGGSYMVNEIVDRRVGDPVATAITVCGIVAFLGFFLLPVGLASWVSRVTSPLPGEALFHLPANVERSQRVREALTTHFDAAWCPETESLAFQSWNRAEELVLLLSRLEDEVHSEAVLRELGNSIVDPLSALGSSVQQAYQAAERSRGSDIAHPMIIQETVDLAEANRSWAETVAALSDHHADWPWQKAPAESRLTESSPGESSSIQSGPTNPEPADLPPDLS